MFGLVKPYVPELRVRENELYRAVYCGLCRELGASCGRLSPLGLSYDFVFLTLCRLAASGGKPKFSPRRCAVHPFKKRPMLESCGALTFSAMASAVLTRGKLYDDLADERGWRKFKAAIAVPWADGAVKKSRATKEFTDGVQSRLRELSDAEKQCAASAAKINAADAKAASDTSTANAKAASDKSAAADANITPDTLADLFGDVLGYVFSYGINKSDGAYINRKETSKNAPSESEKMSGSDGGGACESENITENSDLTARVMCDCVLHERVMYEIGFRTGRFIYLADAADDFADDKKSGSFNAFASVYPTVPDFDCARPLIYDACLCELSRLEAAAALLGSENGDVGAIIDNIVTLGMPAVCESLTRPDIGKSE